MRLPSKLLALSLAAAMQPVVAGVITLDFEEISTTAPIGNRYYAEHKVTFGPNAWGVSATDDDAPDCSGSYYFVPRAKLTANCGAMVVGTSGGNANGLFSFTISSDSGFVDGIDFWFATRGSAPARVEVLDAAGGLVVGSDLLTASCNAFCNWESSSSLLTKLQFASAKSIVFYSGDQKLMLDDLVLRTASPQNVPEPASLALVLGSLGALGWARKRAIG